MKLETNFTLKPTVEEYTEVYINGLFFTVKKQSESIISGSF